MTDRAPTPWENGTGDYLAGGIWCFFRTMVSALAEIEAIRAAASSPLFVVFRISLFINILILFLVRNYK